MVVRRYGTGIHLRGTIFVAASAIAGGSAAWTAVHQLGHEANVRDCQTKCLNPRQMLLVGECGDLPAQLIESFVQVEHPTAFADVGRPPLGNGGDSATRFLGGCRSATAA